MKIHFLLLSVTLSALFITGCGNGNDNSDPSAADSLIRNNEPLTETQAQAQLIDLFNKVSNNMNEIKALEQQMVGSNGNERIEIQTDIATLQAELETRRAEIETLKQRLSASETENSRLLLMIKNLESQVATYEASIAELTRQLTDANVQIASLSGTVEQLNLTVDSTTTELQQAQQSNVAMQQHNTELNDQINRCYYVIGSKSELKKHNIIDSGFLRKTKVRNDFVGNTYFTQADRRTLRSIPTHSKKAKVLSQQPQDSYSITTDDAGNKVVNILDANRFWGTVNYLVIQVD